MRRVGPKNIGTFLGDEVGRMFAVHHRKGVELGKERKLVWEGTSGTMVKDVGKGEEKEYVVMVP